MSCKLNLAAFYTTFAGCAFMVYEVLQKYLQICAKIKQTEREEKKEVCKRAAEPEPRQGPGALLRGNCCLLNQQANGNVWRAACGMRQADEEAAKSGTIWVLVARIEVARTPNCELRTARGKRADCVLATCNNMQKDFRQFSLGSPLPHVRASPSFKH